MQERYFTKNNAMFLIWTVTAMAFRASSNGATASGLVTLSN
jgi:hypothetical protein